MKVLLATDYYTIPEGVELWVKSRQVTVKGPRGRLQRNFKHLNVDLRKVEDGRKVRVDIWFSKGKEKAAIRTVMSHIENMVVGVTKGYRYKMRLAYAHFPINVNLVKGKTVEIRNFLGEKRTRRIEMLGDTTITRSEEIKDQLELEGNDLELVSRSAALVHQSCLVRRKDIRKFLDGIYVSEKGPIEADE